VQPAGCNRTEGDPDDKDSKEANCGEICCTIEQPTEAQPCGAEGQPRCSGQIGTKQSAAIEMLRSPGGATIAALTKATGWQSHSVRGFLAGVVRKRLKLDLESAVVEGIRIYRITAKQGSTPAETRADGRKS
jgi:hypothetical protein